MATNTRSLRKRKEPDGVTSSMAIPNPPKKVKSEAAEKTPKKQAAAKKQETTKKQAETTKKQATTKRKAEPLALAKEAPEGLSLTSRTPKVPEAASQGPVIKRAPSLNDVEYFKHKSTLHRQLEYGFKHIATLAPDLRVGVGCSKEAADAVKKEDRVGVTISQVSGEAIAGLFADLRTGVWNLLKSKFVDEELEALTSPIIKKLSEISPKARGFSSHAGRGTMVIEGIIWKRLQSLIFDRKSADWYKKDPWIPLEASFKAAKGEYQP
ncbi:hypothetical protein B0T17DRAFT_519325 [Bombardia bombarda]|uniref:Uncharacterized protein n=1 Tax=Bombardia bombarda TaxID=252184 RepID=A0AA39XMA2_9PEZI|nr:hypothetical protein B0T17DRAFT_519325 [Bombardia bombarda]